MSFPFHAAIQKVRSMLGLRPRAPDKQKHTRSDESPPQKINLILNQNTDTMSMFSYGVGGNEVKVDANEAIQDIQENKTLLVSKLTNDAPIKPEIITGLRTVEDVFRYFQPTLNVEHEGLDGQTKKEEFKFKNVADFTPDGLTQQSPFLKELNLQQEQYNTIIRQIKTNKVLRTMLENPESKEAFIHALKAVAKELQDAR